MSDNLLGPGTKIESCHVFIGENLPTMAAKITIEYFPSVVDLWMVEDALEDASSRIAEHITKALNTSKET